MSTSGNPGLPIHSATSPDLFKPGLQCVTSEIHLSLHLSNNELHCHRRAFGQEPFYPGYGCYDPSVLPLEYFGDAGLSGCGSNELLITFDSFTPLTGSFLLSENECAESFYPDQGLSLDALPVNDLGTSPTFIYTTPYPPLPNAADAWIPPQSFGDFLPYTQHLSQEQPSISSPDGGLSLDDQQQYLNRLQRKVPPPHRTVALPGPGVGSATRVSLLLATGTVISRLSTDWSTNTGPAPSRAVEKLAIEAGKTTFDGTLGRNTL